MINIHWEIIILLDTFHFSMDNSFPVLSFFSFYNVQSFNSKTMNEDRDKL